MKSKKEAILFMMVQICLLGRGGQGIKSASHVVSTAAFLEGNHVQDQPLYGAERRGAPVTAFIRVSNEPILERGHATDPSFLIVTEESLLKDATANSLGIISGRTVLFVGSQRSSGQIRAKYDIKNTVVTLDLFRLADEILGNPQMVGAAVAGITARLLSLDPRNLKQALSLELNNIGIKGEELEKNIRLATTAYESANPPTRVEYAGEAAGATVARKTEHSFMELRYQGAETSTCTILAPGNTSSRRVGDWSLYKPLINYDECTKCMICFVYCPDGAITINKEDSYPTVNYGACKGCDICHTECPVKVISMVRRADEAE